MLRWGLGCQIVLGWLLGKEWDPQRKAGKKQDSADATAEPRIRSSKTSAIPVTNCTANIVHQSCSATDYGWMWPGKLGRILKELTGKSWLLTAPAEGDSKSWKRVRVAHRFVYHNLKNISGASFLFTWVLSLLFSQHRLNKQKYYSNLKYLQ